LIKSVDDVSVTDATMVKPPRTLTPEEHENVLSVMHEDRFVDKAPREIYAALLDEGTYLCSWRTMYRILHAHDEVRERRNIVRRPQYKKPELLATAPNQVWSWDITKLRGPEKWSSYYLYVILDIFSRYAVGWMVARRQTSELAQRLIDETCQRQKVKRDTLIIHSDNGAPMIAKGTAELMADLGVTKSHSRPHVSDDNPYSESQFSTLKLHPTFPDRFGGVEDARAFCQRFFGWYNDEHYHTGIALMTPTVVHYGEAEDCSRERQAVLSKAFEKHPERFVRGRPKTLVLPEAAWINPPKPTDPDATILATTGSGTIITSVR
jgi:putative transposase